MKGKNCGNCRYRYCKVEKGLVTKVYCANEVSPYYYQEIYDFFKYCYAHEYAPVRN